MRAARAEDRLREQTLQTEQTDCDKNETVVELRTVTVTDEVMRLKEENSKLCEEQDRLTILNTELTSRTIETV